MPEVAHARKDHGDLTLIRSSDDLVVAHAAAGLDDTTCACVHDHIEAVAKRKERITGNRTALQ